ncbi:maleylpyruvate isomerase family mycothiol-dependent enzyme [Streptacidiphilus albus]|uniref:maleylpyruvate isomerase family mycothiol-dependent enzyme n=1 Tax=Streptacidiphilus albus TaxID=105425 RepID=UPI00054B07B4|nr:maleylpyruvate isomerase family mycothiol-dependent enzyme [Streptacidiphilus albus]
MTAPLPGPDGRAPLHEAILATAESVAALLRTGVDPAVRVPGSEWSVGEAAAHLALANRLMADLAAGLEPPYGDGTPGGLAAANAVSLAEFTERAPAPLADAITAGARDFVAASAALPPSTPTVTPMGPMELSVLDSYLLTHVLGHGWDLARALRRPHMLDRERAELCLPFLTTAMPRVVDRQAVDGLTARFTLGLRGGPRFTAAFERGVLSVTPGSSPRPDCTIVTEPVTFLLIALGRCNPWSAIARGRITAWGRRPLLAPAFPAFFRAP